jgi:hypothetical protein
MREGETIASSLRGSLLAWLTVFCKFASKLHEFVAVPAMMIP